MGATCCNYQPKDPNHENFGGKTIEKRNAKLYVLDPEKGAKALAHAANHLSAVVKVQAFARGCLSRARNGHAGKKKNTRKRRGSDKGLSDLEQKMLSARSGQFRGGMPSNRRNDSGRNGLVYAKALAEMPDYSNEATKATEKQVGPFEWDEDEAQYGNDLIERGPHELDNCAIYKG